MLLKKNRLLLGLLVFGLLLFYIVPRCIVSWRFAGKVYWLNSSSSLKDFSSFKFDEKDTLRFYRGLQHNFFNPSGFLLDVWFKKTQKIEDFWISGYQWHPSNSFVQSVAALLNDHDNFCEFVSVKQCGGFHPDFALEIREARTNRSTNVLFCLGCGDLLIVTGSKSIALGIKNEVWQRLKEDFMVEL